MISYPKSVKDLVDQLSRLPGIGQKTAQRLALHIINLSQGEVQAMAKALIDAKANTHFCKRCFNLTDEEYCGICKNSKRDFSTVCVVDTPRDLMAIERTREYHGVYHVLHGSISPLDDIGPEDIKIKELITRIGNESIQEIILANSPTIEGESTAVYLSKLLSSFDLRVTRIAHGVPVGGDLEYADEITLVKAMESRHPL